MQLEFFEIPSPCIGICELDEKGHCLGCMRSRDERQDWKAFTNDEKQKVIKRCFQRKKRKKNKQNTLHDTKQAPRGSTPENEADMQPSLLDPPSKVKISPNTDLDFSEFEL